MESLARASTTTLALSFPWWPSSVLLPIYRDSTENQPRIERPRRHDDPKQERDKLSGRRAPRRPETRLRRSHEKKDIRSRFPRLLCRTVAVAAAAAAAAAVAAAGAGAEGPRAYFSHFSSKSWLFFSSVPPTPFPFPFPSATLANRHLLPNARRRFIGFATQRQLRIPIGDFPILPIYNSTLFP
jgi:hypothetical protein